MLNLLVPGILTELVSQKVIHLRGDTKAVAC